MAGVKGQITRSINGQQRTVYLSNVLGLWLEGKTLHVTVQKGQQDLHTSMSPPDGIAYDLLRALWSYGILNE